MITKLKPFIFITRTVRYVKQHRLSCSQYELGVELIPYDTTKYSFDEFGVTGTTTIIRFEDGNIVNKVNGNVGEDAFREFIGKYAAAAT